MNPMARRNLLLEAEARRLEEGGWELPIIAAGSTGSIPATAGLLGVVAGLPAGALVLARPRHASGRGGLVGALVRNIRNTA